MNKLVKAISCALLSLMCVAEAYAQSWNLVWQEDFGVVPDSQYADFADPSKAMVGHRLAGKDGSGKYVAIQDGLYAIVSHLYQEPMGSWWVECDDHTGNKNGGMLVVNTAGQLEGEIIYKQKIEFPICSTNKYKFVIYAASNTNFGEGDVDILLASLELQVYASDGTLLGNKETGSIPKILDGYDTSKPRVWTKYEVEFDPGNYEWVEFQLINRARCTLPGKEPEYGWSDEAQGNVLKCSAGNDFVLDDIQLFRQDSETVPDPDISNNTLAQETSLNGCIYSSAYSIPDKVLDEWHKLYTHIYFLWQETEDGYNWSDLPEPISGIDKTKTVLEVDINKSVQYRVIITGADESEAKAKEIAKQISTSGGPDDGCYLFSISNTLAAALPKPDCKYRENLKTLWTEDFGIADTLETKICAEAKGVFYEDNGMDFDAGKYVVCSMPDVAVKQSQSWNNYPANEYKTCRDQRGDGGAMLFGALSKTDPVIYSKSFSGPFCNCKAYMFNFNFYKAVSWATVPIRAEVLDGNDVIGEATAVIGGGEGGWRRVTVPFQLPADFAGSVLLRISQDIDHQYANDGSMFAIDDISVTMCGETMPKTSIGINGTNAIAEFGFECSDDTKPRTADLYGLDGWKKDYPNVSFVWQRSDDGGKSWIVLNETSESIEYTGEAEYSLYRVVIGETAAVTQQVVGMGKPSDNCSMYYITNTVGFKCKEAGCRKPKLSMEKEDLVQEANVKVCLGKGETVATVDTVFYAMTGTNIDKFYYQTKKAKETVWETEEEIDLTKNADGAYSVTLSGAESFDYRLWAVNDTCKSDTIEWSVDVYEYLEMKPIDDTVMCENADLEIEFETVNGIPTQYTYSVSGKPAVNYHPGGFIHTTPTIAGEKKHRTVSVYASYDGECKSEPITFEVGYELEPKATLVIQKNTVCKGDMVSLQTLSMTQVGFADATNEYTRTLTATDDDGEREIDMSVLTDNPTSNTIYTLSVVGKYCTTPDVSTKTVEVELPQAIDLATAPSPEVSLTDPNNANVCEGTTVEFEASGENLVSWDWEVKKKGDADFSKLEAGSTTLTKSIVIEDETAVRVSAPVASTNVCSSARSEVIVIKAEKKPDFVLAADKERVCESGAVNVSVTSDLDLSAYNIVYKENGTEATLGADGKAVVNVSGNDVECEVSVTGQYCTQTETRSVSIIADRPITFTASVDKTAICEEEDVVFSISGAEAGDLEWYEVNEDNSETAFAMPADLKVSPSEDIRLYATTPVSGACEGMKSDDFAITVEKKMTVEIDPAADQKICSGTEVEIKATISGNTPSSVVWTKNGTQFGTTNNISDEPTADATYKVTVSGSECDAIEASVKIEVESPSDLSIAADKALICEGESVTLTPNYGSNVEASMKWWKQEEGGAKTQMAEATTVSPTKNTSYYLSVVGDVCAELYSEAAKVEVEEKIEFELKTDAEGAMCEEGSVNVSANVTSGSVASYTFTVNGTDMSSSLSAGMTYRDMPTGSTTYALSIEGAACEAVSHSATVDIEKKPKLTFTVSKSGICEGDQVALDITSEDAEGIKWEVSTDNGGTFTDMGSFTESQTREPVESTVYRVSTTGKQVCDEVVITQKVDVEKVFDVALEDKEEACPGVDNTIKAAISGNPKSVVWERSTDGSYYTRIAQDIDQVNVSPNETTKYRITATGKYCEEKSDEITLKVAEVPYLTLEASSQHICEGDELMIETKFSNDNFSEASIEWTETNVATKETNKTNGIQGLAPTPTSTSTYSVSATTPGGCPIAVAQTLVTVDERIEASVRDTVVCEGNKVKMQVEAKGRYTYEWTFEGEEEMVLSNSATMTTDGVESKTVIIKVVNGYCTKTLQANMEVVGIPMIESMEEGDGNSFVINVTNGSGNYLYDFGKGYQESNVLDSVVYGRRYRISIKDEAGCISDTVLYTPTYELVISPVFTPNGDGVNDKLEIENIERYPNAKIVLYDRTGKVILNVSGADFEGWDGTYNGHALPSTDYWYEIRVNEIDMTYIGHFTLLRGE